MITSAVELSGRSPSPPRASLEASSLIILLLPHYHGQSPLAALAWPVLAVGLPALRGRCWLACSLPGISLLL